MSISERELLLEEEVNSFKFREDSSRVKRIKSRIAEIELAIKHTKKTTRIHQNEKNLHKAKNNLFNAIYQNNKFEIFDLMNEKMDIELTKGIDIWLNDFTQIEYPPYGKSLLFSMNDERSESVETRYTQEV